MSEYEPPQYFCELIIELHLPFSARHTEGFNYLPLLQQVASLLKIKLLTLLTHVRDVACVFQEKY